MKYYAHFGHDDFILCLGTSGDLDQGLLPQLQRGAGERLRALRGRPAASSCSAATSTTGASPSSTPGCSSNIGQRLCARAEHLDGEEMFLANYADGADRRCRCPSMIDDFHAQRQDRQLPLRAADHLQLPHGRRLTPTAGVDGVRGHHAVGHLDQRRLLRLPPARSSTTSSEGEELVEEPFDRLIGGSSSSPTTTTASGWRWTRSRTSRIWTRCSRAGSRPWEVWKRSERSSRSRLPAC